MNLKHGIQRLAFALPFPGALRLIRVTALSRSRSFSHPVYGNTSQGKRDLRRHHHVIAIGI